MIRQVNRQISQSSIIPRAHTKRNSHLQTDCSLAQFVNNLTRQKLFKMLNTFWWNLLQSQAISALYLQASLLNTPSQASTPLLTRETIPSPNLSPAPAAATLNSSSLVAPAPATSTVSSNPLELLLLHEQYLNTISEDNRNSIVASYFDRLLQLELDQQQQPLSGSGDARIVNGKVSSKTNHAINGESDSFIQTSIDKLINNSEKLENSSRLSPIQVSLGFPNASKHANYFLNSTEFG